MKEINYTMDYLSQQKCPVCGERKVPSAQYIWDEKVCCCRYHTEMPVNKLYSKIQSLKWYTFSGGQYTVIYRQPIEDDLWLNVQLQGGCQKPGTYERKFLGAWLSYCPYDQITKDNGEVIKFDRNRYTGSEMIKSLSLKQLSEYLMKIFGVQITEEEIV